MRCTSAGAPHAASPAGSRRRTRSGRCRRKPPARLGGPGPTPLGSLTSAGSGKAGVLPAQGVQGVRQTGPTPRRWPHAGSGPEPGPRRCRWRPRRSTPAARPTGSSRDCCARSACPCRRAQPGTPPGPRPGPCWNKVCVMAWPPRQAPLRNEIVTCPSSTPHLLMAARFQHVIGIHQEHPVIKIDFDDVAIHQQAQAVAPAEHRTMDRPGPRPPRRRPGSVQAAPPFGREGPDPGAGGAAVGVGGSVRPAPAGCPACGLRWSRRSVGQPRHPASGTSQPGPAGEELHQVESRPPPRPANRPRLLQPARPAPSTMPREGQATSAAWLRPDSPCRGAVGHARLLDIHPMPGAWRPRASRPVRPVSNRHCRPAAPVPGPACRLGPGDLAASKGRFPAATAIAPCSAGSSPAAPPLACLARAPATSATWGPPARGMTSRSAPSAQTECGPRGPERPGGRLRQPGAAHRGHGASASARPLPDPLRAAGAASRPCHHGRPGQGHGDAGQQHQSGSAARANPADPGKEEREMRWQGQARGWRPIRPGGAGSKVGQGHSQGGLRPGQRREGCRLATGGRRRGPPSPPPREAWSGSLLQAWPGLHARRRPQPGTTRPPSTTPEPDVTPALRHLASASGPSTGARMGEQQAPTAPRPRGPRSSAAPGLGWLPVGPAPPQQRQARWALRHQQASADPGQGGHQTPAATTTVR